MKYWTLKRRLLAALCIGLHLLVLLNVYRADQRTPRIVTIRATLTCPTVHRGVTL